MCIVNKAFCAITFVDLCLNDRNGDKRLSVAFRDFCCVSESKSVFTSKVRKHNGEFFSNDR